MHGENMTSEHRDRAETKQILATCLELLDLPVIIREVDRRRLLLPK